ncbi:holin [Gilvimarinus chinensis]|uniref:holin n=1 Tax=Gilvimarinus chinensis TaxID=396005 RepID=UPI00037B687D|nr:holin [Gilvimarinus chinensis]
MSLSNHISQHAEQLIIGASNKVVAVGASASGVSAVASRSQALTGLGLDVVEWCGVIGAVVAVAGFLVSWYYQHQRNKRDIEHKRQIIEFQTGQYPAVTECESER